MTKASGINLFDSVTSTPVEHPQVTPNEQVAQMQDRVESLFSKNEAEAELARMKNSPKYEQLSREEWQKKNSEKYGLHIFMMTHFSSDPPINK